MGIVVGLRRRAGREQQPRNFGMTVARGPQQRAVAIVVAMVDLGAVRQQEPHDLDVAVACGIHQRRIGFLVIVGICARIEQRLYLGGVALLCGRRELVVVGRGARQSSNSEDEPSEQDRGSLSHEVPPGIETAET